MSTPANFNEITIPDSNICQQATRLVREVSSQCLCNHCLRTYFFGSLIGQKNNLKYDRELFYLSAVLHDLGLTERFTQEQRFEVDSADAAKAFTLKHGLSAEKAEILWDAIALHTSIGIATKKEPEVALVHLGAGMDVFGFGIEDLDSKTVERLFEEYPRLNLSTFMPESLIANLKQKNPQTVAFTWMAEFGKTHIPGFACPSFNDMLANSPFTE